jgi:ubiquinone/menaquinone biosynthesis C-methylase UbiE
MPTLLHVGCGDKTKAQTTRGFDTPQWTELRLDIDPDVNPDIVADMTDLSAMADGAVDAVFSSHNIEHLYPHQAPLALAEFHRVLSPQGFLVITCPDLQSVALLIAQGMVTEPAYHSPMGPISPLDMLYGHSGAMAAGKLYMAHRGGFTLQSLHDALKAAGFRSITAVRRRTHFDLWALASKARLDEAALASLAADHLPAPNPGPAS